MKNSEMKSVILENQKLKRENEDLRRQLAETKTNLQTALSSVSHEMKNTLTLVIGNSRLLEQEQPSIASGSRWKSIQSDLLHMRSFLLDVSSFKSMDQIRLDRRLCDLSAFLRDVCRSCGGWFDGSHRRLVLSCPDTAEVLYADTNKLYQALVNLIKNGLEALGTEGTVSILLRTGTEEEQKRIGAETAVIEVKDTGCGLSREDMENALRPFCTTKQDGTGLGLPIAKSITEAHGGILSLSSEPGKGTTAALLLPRLPSLYK